MRRLVSPAGRNHCVAWVLLAVAVVVASTANAAPVPTVSVEPPSTVAISKLSTAATGKGRPLVFAMTLDIDATTDDGVWDEPVPGTARWRLQLHSPGAQSVSLMLNRFSGPGDTQLYLRSVTSDMTQGPYSPEEVLTDGRLWTALVFDEAAILEIFVPAAERSELDVHVTALHYGYLDLRKHNAKSNRFIGSADSCNIDVVCDEGNAWQNEIRSVAALTFQLPGGALALCTGNLVNNTAQDDMPLLLTGHHCTIRQNNAGTVVAYWNFEAESCGVNPEPTFNQSQSGATFLATHERSDATLLRLNQMPQPAFNVYYTGWDARLGIAPANSGVSIHHPSGDIKKISVFDTPLVRNVETIEQQTVEVWRVRWSKGTTEGGSSGAGLWNDSNLLVGTLFGGSASCDNPGLEDVYGRLEVGWAGGGELNNSLCPHLDPLQTGSRILTGRNQGEDAPTQPETEPGNACPAGPAPPPPPDSSGGHGFPMLFLLATILLRRLNARQSQKLGSGQA